MTATGRRLTLQQFLALPEEKPALEYVDGEVRQKVSPKSWHGLIQFEIATRLVAAGLLALPETRVTYAGRSLVPDVLAFRPQRVPLDADGEVENDLTTPPDVAVEIVSPGQSIAEQRGRCRWYVAHGTAVSVLVDPERRTIRVVRPSAETDNLRGSDAVDLTDLAPGLAFTVNELFAALRPRRTRGRAD